MIKAGQIWQETSEKRYERYIKVLESPRDWIRARTCTLDGVFVKGSRVTHLSESTFPKRFTLVQDCK